MLPDMKSQALIYGDLYQILPPEVREDGGSTRSAKRMACRVMIYSYLRD